MHPDLFESLRNLKRNNFNSEDPQTFSRVFLINTQMRTTTSAILLFSEPSTTKILRASLIVIAPPKASQYLMKYESLDEPQLIADSKIINDSSDGVTLNGQIVHATNSVANLNGQIQQQDQQNSDCRVVNSIRYCKGQRIASPWGKGFITAVFKEGNAFFNTQMDDGRQFQVDRNYINYFKGL